MFASSWLAALELRNTSAVAAAAKHDESPGRAKVSARPRVHSNASLGRQFEAGPKTHTIAQRDQQHKKKHKNHHRRRNNNNKDATTDGCCCCLSLIAKQQQEENSIEIVIALVRQGRAWICYYVSGARRYTHDETRSCCCKFNGPKPRRNWQLSIRRRFETRPFELFPFEVRTAETIRRRRRRRRIAIAIALASAI